MDKENKIEDWERMFKQRLASSPQDISPGYAIQMIIVLFKFKDIMKEIPEEYWDQLNELDDDWDDLLTEASRAFYRFGFMDAMQQNEQEGDR